MSCKTSSGCLLCNDRSEAQTEVGQGPHEFRMVGRMQGGFMDEIISKLNEIEKKASDIMEQSNNRKKELSEKMDEKTAAWDKELISETEKQLASLREEMNASIREQLTVQKQSAEKELKELQTSYDQNHTAYVNRLFRQLTGE